MKAKIWRFVLKNDTSIDLKSIIGEVDDFLFFDTINGHKELVGFIIDGILTILKGYAWDGCTPKFSLFGKWFGIPDFKGTYLASLAHDFLLEYENQHTLTRKQIDTVFSSLLKQARFALRWIYGGVVHAYRPISKVVDYFSRS